MMAKSGGGRAQARRREAAKVCQCTEVRAKEGGAGRRRSSRLGGRVSKQEGG